MKNSKLKTPVVLIIFNRPDTTEQGFSEIAKAKPQQLFVVADGPRLDQPEDNEPPRPATRRRSAPRGGSSRERSPMAARAARPRRRGSAPSGSDLYRAAWRAARGPRNELEGPRQGNGI